MRLSAEKENLWPYQLSEGYKVASRATWEYNCIAFVADRENEWWWPDPDGDAKWPENVTRDERLECFAQAFATLGYEVCDDSGLEAGYEKIAIYARYGIPTHAAKQLPDGRWKSKLGAWEDIEHNTVKAVAEHIYGQAVLFMRRRPKT